MVRSPITTHKPDRLFSIKQRSPQHHPTPDRLSPQIKQRSHPQHTQTRSPIPSNQTAIAPHPHKPDRLFPQIKQRSPIHVSDPRLKWC